jgi:opacity protein-like surface antigen
VHQATDFAGLAVLMADVDWIVSARARLGVVAGRALFYATGGVAMTGLSAHVDVLGVHASTSRTSPAFVAGGGVEIGINEHIALRVEALHYFIDGEKFPFPFNSGTARVGGSLTTVRAGLTFFLN